MKKPAALLIILFLAGLISPAQAKDEPLAWKDLVANMQTRIESGSLTKDFRFSFQNTPLNPSSEDELMIYTIRGDGMVFIQMNDQTRSLRISPNELIWLYKFLLEYGLARLPEAEERAADSGSFGIILRNARSRKGVRLYNARNDLDRDIIWQYLFRFGQRLLKEAGLRKPSLTVLPVCKGIIQEDEIDSDSDGIFDWLRLSIGFYNFEPEEYMIDFAGYKQNFFLAQGNTFQEFYLNTYLLRQENAKWRDFFKFKIDSKEEGRVVPYIIDLGLDSLKYKRKDFRSKPDLVFKGNGKWRFKVNLKQAVALEFKKSRALPCDDFYWFNIAGINSSGVKLNGKESLTLKGKDDYTHLIFLGCLTNYLHLVETDAAGAAFEIGWESPDIQRLESRAALYKEMIARDPDPKNVERFKASLEADEDCRKDLESLKELEIRVIYCQPPAQK